MFSYLLPQCEQCLVANKLGRRGRRVIVNTYMFPNHFYLLLASSCKVAFIFSLVLLIFFGWLVWFCVFL